MKPATDSQWQLVQLTRRLRHPVWLLVAALLFFFVSGLFAKLVACCLGITVLLLQQRQHAQQLTWILLLALAFAASFLLTPISGYLIEGSGALGLAAALVVAGLIWLAAATRGHLPDSLPRKSPTLLPVFLMAWIVVLVVVVLPGYDSAPAYRGDEVYHMMSAQMYRLHLQELLVAGWPVVAWGIWAVAAIWCLLRQPTARSMWILLASLLLISLLGSHVVYSDDLLSMELVHDRASRYPTALAWLSGFLAAADFVELRSYFYMDTAFYRILTALSLSVLAFGLALDPRWRHRPLPVILGAVAMLTVPNIHYHAGLLYLDLPVVVAASLILLDGRHILVSEAKDLPSKSSWWLLLLLGMLKESAAPLLAVIVGMRWLYQVWRWRSGELSIKRLLGQEAIVGVAALAPILIYIAIRYQFGARAYGAQFANLLDVGLWMEGLVAIWQQTGPILLAAIAGLVILWRNGRRMEAALLFFTFWGLKAFFQADSAAYASLARFHLYVLPPILILAWEAYTALYARQRVAALACGAMLILLNLVMSPVQLGGVRASNWGETTEAYYPFDVVMEDLSFAMPQARIALANAESEYSLNIFTSQLQWLVTSRILPPYSPDEAENLTRSLAEADKQGINALIYRFEGQPTASLPDTIGEWQLHQTASGTGGVLAVYIRQDLSPR